MENRIVNIGVLFRNNQELVTPFFFFLRKSIQESIIKHRIIAINNGSEDNTENEIKKHLRDIDVLYSSKENAGIAKGRNLIIKIIKDFNGGEYDDLFLLDSDVFITWKNSIERMYNLLIKHRKEKVSFIFGKTHSFPSWALKDSGFDFCLIGKEIFEQIGEFDPEFWMFYDDPDFDSRATEARFKKMFCNESIAVHIWGSTTNYGSEGGEHRKLALEHDKLYYEKKWNKKV
jgi:GT2 family glycosyltransferase